MRPTEQDGSAAQLMERFRQQLVDRREVFGNPSFDSMASKIRHEKGCSGNPNTFGQFARGPLLKVPTASFVRGFALGIGLSEAEAGEWENRRQQLVVECQRLRDDSHRNDARRAPRLNKRLALTAGTVVVLLAGGGLAALHIARGSPTSDNRAATVSGQVRCASGARVVGIYLDSGTPHSGFASFHPGDVASVASYAYSVPKGREYSVHVGCGGTPAAWATDDRSDGVSGRTYSFVCDDQLALARHSHYGTCREQ